MRSPRSTHAALALALASCGAPHAVGPGVMTRGGPRGDAPWALFPLAPGSGRLVDAFASEEGWVSWAGGVRLRMPGALDAVGPVEVADAAFRSPIQVAQEDVDGWVFVTTAGEVFRAATYLGPPRSLGVVSSYTTASVLATERVLLVGLDGVITLVERDALRVLTPTLEASGILGAFVDADLGFVIVEPGVAFRTLDGGRTFSALEAPSALRFVERAVGAAIFWDVLDTPLRGGREGPLAPIAPPPDAPSPRTPAQAVTQAFRIRALGLAPWAVARTTPAEGGAFLAADDDGLVLFPAGIEVSGTLPRHGCFVRSWGDAYLVWYCTEELSIVDGSGRLTPLNAALPPPDGSSGVWLHEPSRTILLPGPCRDQPETDGGSSARCIQRRGAHATIELPEMTVFGITGTTVFGVDYDYDASAYSLVRAPLDGGEATVSPLPEGVTSFLNLSEDGTVYQSFERDGADLLYVVEPGADPDVLPVPYGDVVFADRYHAAASSRGVGAALSEDGGRTWAEVRAPNAGTITTDQLRCGPRACNLGSYVWGPPGLPLLPAEPLAEPLAIAGAEVSLSVLEPMLDARLTCHRVPIWRNGREPLLSSEGGEDDESDDESWDEGNDSSDEGGDEPEPPPRLDVAGGWFQLDVRADALPTRVTASWAGIDARGAFEQRAMAGPVERPTAPPSSSDNALPLVLDALVVTRSLALLQICRWGEARERCSVVAFTHDAPPRVVGSNDEFLPGAPYFPSIVAALPLPGGGAAIAVSTMGEEGWSRSWAARLDRVLELDVHGTVARDRGFSWGASGIARWLAVDEHGTPGLLVARGTSARFHPIDGGLPSALPFAGGRVETLCAARAAGAVDAVAMGESVTVGSESGETQRAHVLVRIAPDGTRCIAGVLRDDTSPGGGTSSLADALGGVVTGAIAEGGATRVLGEEGGADIVCEVTDPATLVARAEGPWGPGADIARGADGALWIALDDASDDLVATVWSLGAGTAPLGAVGPPVSMDGASRWWLAVAGEPYVVPQPFGWDDAPAPPSIVRVAAGGAHAPSTNLLAVFSGGGGLARILLSADPALAAFRVVWPSGATTDAPPGPTGSLPRFGVASSTADGFVAALPTCVPIDRYRAECTVRALRGTLSVITALPDLAVGEVGSGDEHAGRPLLVAGSGHDVAVAIQTDVPAREGATFSMGSGMSPATIVRVLRGRRWTEPAPPIVGSGFCVATPMALALAPLRVVVSDCQGDGGSITHVRVLEPARGAWRDVVPPLELALGPRGPRAAAATFDGDDVVVVSVDADGWARLDRAHAGAWGEPRMLDAAASSAP